MKHRGLVLVAVLMVTSLGGMLAVSLLFHMRAERAASEVGWMSQQAYATALSGIEAVLAVLRAEGLDPQVWQDRPEVFEHQLVSQNGSQRWYYTIFTSDPENPYTPRFGITDTASRINLNTASEAVLARMPGLPTHLAEALLDWRDDDDEPRALGAEQDYYDQLQQPYLIRNGELSTVEELLLIKGFTAHIVYGEDGNLNGVLDPNEDDGQELAPDDDSDGVLNGGLKAIATTFGYEPDRDSEGNPRFDLNGDMEKLRQAGLPETTLLFIEQCRENNHQFNDPSELLEMTWPLNPENGQQTESSGVDAQTLPLVLDKLTVQSENKDVRGRINVNTASAEVLMTLEGIDESLANQIVQRRRNLDPETRRTTAWLYTEGLVSDATKFKGIAPQLTTRSYQYHVRCVGYGLPSGTFKVLEAEVDLATTPPKVLYIRDVTRLGLPFAITETSNGDIKA